MNDLKGYYNIITVYYKDNLTIYNEHIYKAKEPTKEYKGYKFTEVNLAKLPPEYPIKENEYWILVE
jgi:hypothetical protein